MGQEHGHVAGPQCSTQLLDLAARVAEDEPLLSPVEGRDQFGGVLQRAHIVEFHLTGGLEGGVGGGLFPCGIAGDRRMHVRGGGVVATSGAGESRRVRARDRAGGGPAVLRHPAGGGQVHSWGDDLPRAACVAPAPCSAVEQCRRVADGGRQADALDAPSADPFQPFQYGEEVPSAVVTREGVDLVHDDGPTPPRSRAWSV